MSDQQLTLPDGRKVTLRVRNAESYLPNPENTNRGTERGKAAIDASMQGSGFHRSIVVAGDDTVVNGNHSYLAASELGVVESWIEVEVEGDVGVVTKRIDWESAKDPQAIKAAIADNRTSELNFELDPEILAEAMQALGDDVELPASIFTEDELERLIEGEDPEPPEGFKDYDEDLDTEHECPKCGYKWSGIESY